MSANIGINQLKEVEVSLEIAFSWDVFSFIELGHTPTYLVQFAWLGPTCLAVSYQALFHLI